MNENLAAPPLTLEERQLLLEKILSFNDDLVTKYINISGQAFGNALILGSAIMSIPVIIGLVVLYLTDRFSLVGLLICPGAGFLVAAMFASIVASRAKTLVMQDAQPEEILVKIDAYLKHSMYTWEQFIALANETLSAEAPLRAYLDKRPGETIEGEAV